MTCRIRSLGVSVALRCTPALVTAVRRQLSPWIDRDTGPVHLCLRISGGSADSGSTGYVVRDHRQILVTAASVEELMAGLQGWLDREVTRRAMHLTPIHAGVVASGGRAILLPAPSGSGKSTLVAALIARGARYYSDELALLDQRGWVHPYPRHLVIRDGRGMGQPTAPRAFGARSGIAALPVSLILDLRYTALGTFHVDRLTGSEAVLLLLANTPHRMSDVVPTAFLKAASGARSYRGNRGDAHAAAEAILRLVRMPLP